MIGINNFQKTKEILNNIKKRNINTKQGLLAYNKIKLIHII